MPGLDRQYEYSCMQGQTKLAYSDSIHNIPKNSILNLLVQLLCIVTHRHSDISLHHISEVLHYQKLLA